MVQEKRQESDRVTGEKQFSYELTENGKKIDGRPIDTPFLRTTMKLKGMKAAWAVLTKGITLNLCIDGTRAAKNVIFQGDYDDKKWFPGGLPSMHVLGECNQMSTEPK
jgi:hypothetical protein